VALFRDYGETRATVAREEPRPRRRETERRQRVRERHREAAVRVHRIRQRRPVEGMAHDARVSDRHDVRRHPA